MNEIARTVVISAVSGLIAFGGAVLYLGGDDSGPSEPSLTQADVQAVIDLHPPALTPADVQAMIDSQPPELALGNPAYDAMNEGITLVIKQNIEGTFAAFAASAQYANCADETRSNTRVDLLRGMLDYRARDLFHSAIQGCWEDALDRLYNDDD